MCGDCAKFPVGLELLALRHMAGFSSVLSLYRNLFRVSKNVFVAHIGPNYLKKYISYIFKREHQKCNNSPMWLDMEIVQKMLNVTSLRQVTHSVLNMPILRNVYSF